MNVPRLNVELEAVEDHLPGLLSARVVRVLREAQLQTEAHPQCSRVGELDPRTRSTFSSSHDTSGQGRAKS